MITIVVGKEIEKVKGDYESYLNGLNMVGEISYSQYSKLYDEGTKQIQKAYELGKSELQEENKVLAQNLEDTEILNKAYEKRFNDLEKENAELKDYRLTTVAKQQTSMSKYALNLEHKLSWYDNQLTKARELLNEFLDFESSCMERGIYISDKTRAEAEQFLSEVNK